MAARNSAVSFAGTRRCRPAHATGSPSGARITTPRSRPAGPAAPAARGFVTPASPGRRAAVAPCWASRRASVTARASVAASRSDARVTSRSRSAGQQHSMRRTCSTPDTSTAPSAKLSAVAAPAAASRSRGFPRSAYAAIATAPLAPASHAHPAASPALCSHSAAATTAVRRKPLHRWMNDLLGSWEQSGVDTFVILTAHGHDPHQEALSTLRTRRARVFTVDAFALDFAGLLEDPDGPAHGGELDTSLMLYLAPHLVRMDLAQDYLPAPRPLTRFRRRSTSPSSLPAVSPRSPRRPSLASRDKGERLYKMIRERVAARVLGGEVKREVGVT